MPTVSVKWRKEVFPEVEIDTSLPPYFFKCQLFDLTGVPPGRQKIVVKGELLKDDADWVTLGVEDGQQFCMVGSPVQVEDVLPEQRDIPAALLNYGSTCYMNSTLQCLHSVPELKSALARYSTEMKYMNNHLDELSHKLVVATKAIFNDLDESSTPVGAMMFWRALCNKYPQFEQSSHHGIFWQQDAKALWMLLLSTLETCIGSQGDSASPDSISTLFGIEVVSRIYSPSRSEVISEPELLYSLKCDVSEEVDNLHQGIKHGLKSELTLESADTCLKESRINALPRYLTVQFLRAVTDVEQNSIVKISKKIEFPLELDVLDFCSDDLGKKLEASRSQNQYTGFFDLVAVLSHEGKSAELGHYAAWVKQENGQWVQFDDHRRIARVEQDITALSGGGDGHIAYICMYKAVTV